MRRIEKLKLINNENDRLLGTCFQKVAYSILKNVKGFDEKKFWDCQLSIPFHCLVCTENNKIYDFVPYKENEGNIYSFKDRDATIECLLTTIDEYGYAIVGTVTPLLEYYRYYNPGFDGHHYTDGHWFIIFAYDSEDYYYWDDPNLINADRAVWSSQNSAICKYNRKKMDKLFEINLELKILLLNESYWVQNNRYISMMFKQYKAMYFHQSCTFENGRYCYTGNEAMHRLLAHAKEKIPYNDQSLAYKSRTLGSILEWRFGSVAGKLALLNKYLSSSNYQNTQLSDLLTELYKVWQQLSLGLMKYEFAHRNDEYDITDKLSEIITMQNRLADLLILCPDFTTDSRQLDEKRDEDYIVMLQ